MSFLERVSFFIDVIFQKVISLFLFVMFFLFFIQVISRYLFNYGLTWTEELVRYLMIWMTYIGATVLTRDGSQIRMTILEDIFPNMQKWLNLLQSVFSIIFYVIITRMSLLNLNVAKIQTSPSMGVPMNIVYAVIPLSCTIMVLHLILNIYKSLKGVE